MELTRLAPSQIPYPVTRAWRAGDPGRVLKRSSVRRAGRSYPYSPRMESPQPATIALGEVYAPEGSHVLKASDQLHLMLGWLREHLARIQNVALETLAVEGEILRGEIFLKDFTRESRYEIYRMETKAISEFPDVDLDLVVLPRKIEE